MAALESKQMKYLLAALLALPCFCRGAILPDTIGAYQRTSTSVPSIQDQPVWNEYGLKDSEAATYENGSAKFTVDAYQLQDTTGALAAFDWQRPANATPSDVAKLAAQTADSLLLTHGNYLLVFHGYKPTLPELDALAESLKNVDTTALPTLPGFLPSDSLVPDSERYVTGPASLQKFDPGIPPSTAAFHLGAEAQIGTFRGPKGPTTLGIFDYPTPQIAMQKVTDFEKLPGAMVKRSGPLVAVILAPPDPDFAERLLGDVRYEAQITLSEHVPTRRDNIGDLVVNAFILIGILLIFAVVSGLMVGGIRALMRHGRKGEEPAALITLHLE